MKVDFNLIKMWLLVFLLGIVVPFCSGSIEFTSQFLDDIEKKYGDYAHRRLLSWVKLIKENKNLEESKKLEVVNQFFNLFEYQLDINFWGVEDYWETPLELILAGAGDCEDFAIAKYFTLLELGIPDEKLLIMYVKLLTPGTKFEQAHMVLLYYASPSSVPLVLDIVDKEIMTADNRKDLRPIYGFNGKGLWQAKELGIGNRIGESQDLKRWTDLEERMKSGKISKWKGAP